VVAPLEGLGTRKEDLEHFGYMSRNQIEMHVENEQVGFTLEVGRLGGIRGNWPTKKLHLTTWHKGTDICHDTGSSSTGK
jgi:hypothetical protein